MYTIDIDINALKIEDKDPDSIDDLNQEQITNKATMKKLERYKKRIIRKSNYEEVINDLKKVWVDFEETDEDLPIMRKKYQKPFYDAYYEGFNNFQAGEWGNAKVHFEKAVEILGERDGPTHHLMEIMRKYNFVRPKDWKRGEEDGH